MTRFRRRLHDLRAALYRFLRIESPTGMHLPMRSLVADHSADVTPGPLTDFRQDPPRHRCGAACEPSSPSYRPCFTQVPYGSENGGDAPC